MFKITVLTDKGIIQKDNHPDPINFLMYLNAIAHNVQWTVEKVLIEKLEEQT